MNEEWRKLTLLDERYEFSNLGNVRSNGKMMHPCKNSLGYLHANFIDKFGNPTHKSIHRLIALAFIPNPEPEIYKEINHKDGNKQNNCVENLEWCTRSYNILHAFRNGLKVNRKGADHPAAVTIYQFSLDGKFIKKWGSISDCATFLKQQGDPSTFKMIRDDIIQCASHRSKTAHGYIFSYEPEINLDDHEHIKHRKAIIGTHKKDGTELHFASFHDAEGFVTKDGKKLSATLICACIKGRGRSSHGGYNWRYE